MTSRFSPNGATNRDLHLKRWKSACAKMASYRLEVKRSAEKEIRNLSPEVVDRVWVRIRALTTNARPRGAKKLSGDVPGYRLRVGDYRIIYEIDDNERLVSVRQVRHRREAYR